MEDFKEKKWPADLISKYVNLLSEKPPPIPEEPIYQQHKTVAGNIHMSITQYKDGMYIFITEGIKMNTNISFYISKDKWKDFVEFFSMYEVKDDEASCDPSSRSVSSD